MPAEALLRSFGSLLQPCQSLPARLGQHSRVTRQIGKAKIHQAGLARAEQLARAAEPEIGLGDLEAVMFLFHDAQTLGRYGAATCRD